jgi:uncharacterized protein (TIGR03437 family)
VSQGSLLFRLACGILPAIAAWGQQYTISTVAGNQSLGAGYGGDNDAATSDQLNGPLAMALDSKGNLYIADSLNHRVRKVSGGTITTIAGTGTAGYSGDGGQATSAELNTPSGIAVDSAGNVYISDTKNFVIRKISTSGIISTYAGNEGLGAGYGGDNGSPTSAGAQFDTPLGLAFDPSGNLYIADASTNTGTSGNLIRKISADGTTLTTAVGLGLTIQLLNYPVSIAIDPTATYMYIADLGNKRIARFEFATQRLTTFAGNGASGYSPDGVVGIGTMLNNAAGVAVDSFGNVEIADTVNDLIRVVTPAGVMTTIAGHVLSGGRPIPGYAGDGGPATSAQLYSPKGLFIDHSNNVYIADTGNNVIRLLQPSYPTILSGGIGNAFSYKTQVSPGAWAVAYGTGFGTATLTPNAPYPSSAGVVSVMVNGLAAPLYYVSPTQIDFQVPWETGLGPASITVNVNGGPSNTASVQVVSAGPGLYSIVENSNFSFNSASNPIAGGGTVLAYLTGSGPVSVTQADGKPAQQASVGLVNVTSTCTATVGSSTAQVTFCGLVPGSVGLVQANITVPSLGTGSYPLTVSINGQASNTATVYVK